MPINSKERKFTGYRLVAIVVIVLLGCISYSNTFNASFHFDDWDNILNKSLKMETIGIDRMSDALTEGLLKERPISNLSFALNYFIGGQRVQGYHLVNLMIHLITGIILYHLFRLTLRQRVIKKQCSRPELVSFFAALLWVVHPLCTQSVTYIVQRMNSMSSMFYVMALLFYILGRNIQLHVRDTQEGNRIHFFYFIACIFAGGLALGSKEIAATLPITIFLYEWFFYQDLRWQWIKNKIYWLVITLIIFVVITYVYTGKGPLTFLLATSCGARDFDTHERLLTQFRVIVHYLSLLVYPYFERLLFDYNFSISKSFTVPLTTLFSFLFLASIFLIAVVKAKTYRLASFCVLWFYINLVIESSVICLEMVFEHRTYLPSMFFVLLLVLFLSHIIKHTKLFISVLVSIAIIFSFWTYQRNVIWSDDVLFWQDSVSKSPGKWRTYNNLGHAYAQKRQFNLAIQAFHKALEISPDNTMLLNNVALASQFLHKFEEAVFFYERTLEVDSNNVQALTELGRLQWKMGEKEIALRLLQRAYELRPDSYDINDLLANVLMKNGDVEKALSHIEFCLEKNPDKPEMKMELGIGLMRTGRYREAEEAFREALSRDSEILQASYNLALLLGMQGRYAEALNYYRKVAMSSGNNVPVDYNLGNTYLRLGQYERALKSYSMYLAGNAHSAEALNNMGLALISLGRQQKAEEYFRQALQINPHYRTAQNNLDLLIELQQSKANGE